MNTSSVIATRIDEAIAAPGTTETMKTATGIGIGTETETDDATTTMTATTTTWAENGRGIVPRCWSLQGD